MSLTPAAAEFKRQTFYEGLAIKLDDVAKIVRKRPDFDQTFADRLTSLAGQIREDTQPKQPAS